MVAGIRGARFVTIPKAGHSSSLEQPEAVIAAMRELFQSAEHGQQSA
jgi:pimeloyl-ACP methyl ester carboxylesterase